MKWPTLRGGYLTDEAVERIRSFAYGVIFLDGTYQTRLNFDKGPPDERAVFFEHLHRVENESIFLLCWVGNYHAGSIFHCAWQFPQMYHWGWQNLEKAAVKTYFKVATAVQTNDSEVRSFLEANGFVL